MKAGWFAIFTVFLVGCAAQDSHRQYFGAQKQYEAALANSPKSGDLAKAKEHIDAGRQALKEGRYDIASKEFKESNKISEPIADPEGYKKKLAAKGVLIPPPSMPPTAASSTVTVSPAQSAQVSTGAGGSAASAPLTVTTPQPAQTVTQSKEEMKPRSLPAQALAKYLAAKNPRSIESPTIFPEKKKLEDHRESKVVEKPEPKPTAKSSHSKSEPVKDARRIKLGAQSGSRKPIPQKGPDPDEVEAPAMRAADDDEDGKVLSKEETKQDPTGAEKVTVTKDQGNVVKSPARPIDKFVSNDKPKVETPALVQPVEKPKTKIPGSLRFGSNEASLEADSMLNLDQTSKFLLDNPSTSVVFQGILGPGEANTLVDSRFESLRSYLVGKGVPDDQVRLDQKRRSGTRAEFEMFIVDH